MSPNDPRVKHRIRVLEEAGFSTADNGVTYTRPSGLSWKLETTFPYNRFVARDKRNLVQDAWDQEYFGDAR